MTLACRKNCLKACLTYQASEIEHLSGVARKRAISLNVTMRCRGVSVRSLDGQLLSHMPHSMHLHDKELVSMNVRHCQRVCVPQLRRGDRAARTVLAI